MPVCHPTVRIMEILFSVFVVTGGVMVGARAMMLSKPEVIRPVAKPLNRTPDRERGWRGSVAAALQMMRHGQSRLETVSMPVCHTTVRPAGNAVVGRLGAPEARAPSAEVMDAPEACSRLSQGIPALVHYTCIDDRYSLHLHAGGKHLALL
ncbi:MAG: hypothetical protein KatS3mg056_2505 [Chloroflexus sp.]|nr:MAG: hypothetical protein KatS3mg056_2505 [Chloroflexus sp.]